MSKYRKKAEVIDSYNAGLVFRRRPIASAARATATTKEMNDKIVRLLGTSPLIT